LEIREEKILYLKNYRVLLSKKDRLKEMCEIFPERKEEYKEQINNTVKSILRIEDAIEKVDGGILSEILFQKYVLGRSLETVSYNLNYSKRQIERLHINAVEKISFF